MLTTLNNKTVSILNWQHSTRYDSVPSLHRRYCDFSTNNNKDLSVCIFFPRKNSKALVRSYDLRKRIEETQKMNNHCQSTATQSKVSSKFRKCHDFCTFFVFLAKLYFVCHFFNIYKIWVEDGNEYGEGRSNVTGSMTGRIVGDHGRGSEVYDVWNFCCVVRLDL